MKKKILNSHNYGIVFILPFFIVFLIFSVYPIIYTLFLSFHKWDGLAAVANIGWTNFTRLLHDDVFYLCTIFQT